MEKHESKKVDYVHNSEIGLVTTPSSSSSMSGKRIYLPENLDLDKLLREHPPQFKRCPKKYRNYRDAIAYILHLINSINYRKDIDFNKTKGFTAIHKVLLSRRVHEYRAYIDYLKEHNIVIEGNSYVPGKRSTGLKFVPEYQTKVKENFITTPTLIKSITSRKKRGDLKKMEEIHFLKHWFNDNLIINREVAISILEKDLVETRKNKLSSLKHLPRKQREDLANEQAIVTYNSKYINVEKIVNSEYENNLIVDTTGARFHSPLVVLKKELRKCLTYAGQKLVNIDIVNSQPFLSLIFLDLELFESLYITDLLASYNDLYAPQLIDKGNVTIEYTPYSTMLVNLIKQKSNEPDMLEFKDSVISGEYYETFSRVLYNNNLIPEEILSISDKSNKYNEIRNFAKKATFSSFFSRNNAYKYNPHVRAFKACFPSVYEIFSLIKQGNHKTLAVSLQRFESDLVLFRVSKDIYNNHPEIPLYTIHDSIATTMGNEKVILNYFQKHIQERIGYSPKFSTDYWS